ncbi:MAG: DUF4393 domain-containing protein [Deltaproteobacteria bacterium]|nr:DUF4393 domain-containing protein [Deltaproteobacteria bacterium]
MEEDKQIIDAVKALGLGEVVPEVYRDMLQPAARQIGDGLATIAKAVKISLAPLEAGIWGYEQIKEWLSIRVTRILADRKTKDIVKPPLSIAGPLVFQLIFVKDEPELREMYASLLSSAMDLNNTSAHPSFVSIIQQLTPDEAKVLKYINTIDKQWPFLSESSILSIELKFKAWCEKANVVLLNRAEAYLDNLVRLRIFSLVTGSNAEYQPAYSSHYADEPESISNEEYAILELSAFGRLFLDACIENDKASNADSV